MNILISGINGFVGSNLAIYLKNLNHRVERIDRNTLNFSDFETVIHLAGIAHDIKNKYLFEDYYNVNTELTKVTFDKFLSSNSKVFIFFSSVKAAADKVQSTLTEEFPSNPATNYGKSKLLAEQYILSKSIPSGKRVYILRPCMIHGKGNKGNLNLLYKFVKLGLPWPLGNFENRRSFCSIENLCFIINELLLNHRIASGVYNVSDDESLSTNDIIRLISVSQGKNARIFNIPKSIIKFVASVGDIFEFPINSKRLNKLTETYVVSNSKLKNAINKPLPINSEIGLMNTFDSFFNDI